MSADAIVARARACVGTRFRAQGRDPEIGLDCLGVVLAAAGRATAGGVPRDYSLRACGMADRAEAGLVAAGAARVSDPAMPGDILLFEPAPGQAHFGVCTDAGLVQAHLGLGRVVEGPADPTWTVHSIWRLDEEG